MRSIFSIVLILTLVLPIALKIAVVSDYFLAYDRYLSQCENRAEPQLECNGTCQLVKELLKVDEPQEPQFPVVLELELPAFVLKTTEAILHPEQSLNPYFPLHSAALVPQPYLEIVVPPPSLIV